jgi:class 3 adenylate cyclase
VKLLPTQLEVALTLGDIETARAAASELAGIAGAFTSPAIQATADASAAAVAFAEGDGGSAEGAAKRAHRVYKETDLTFESAKVSLLLGQIYRAEGDHDAAGYEISAALSTFERIGAVPAAEQARELLAARAQPAGAHGRRVAKTFLFSDIVKSTNLLEAIGDDAWTHLLKWHDDALRKLFTEHAGEEVEHLGDGFFVAFDDAAKAVACAIAIQRSLADHRRAHGFAPQVRIGLHATEAAEVQGNYHGLGVHEAARIGALAEGGEILSSAYTVECVRAPVGTVDERTVTLKGVARPFRVFSISWRES